MEDGVFQKLSFGVNQKGVRDHNERLILTVIRSHGGMPGADIAKVTGLSPQTVSIILRKLEKDKLLLRGEPVRGKVGKPSIPMVLNPKGVYSFGLKVGRRSADLLLLDFAGNVTNQVTTKYPYPLPENVFGFLEAGMADILSKLPSTVIERICGIGIAVPFEVWKWHDLYDVDAEKFRSWKDINFTSEVAKFSELDVFVLNDATAACQAEHSFGGSKSFRDYAYFFIGSFIGGGVVLNSTVFEGNQGNAGALGSMRTTSPLGESQQLIDVASLHLLEARLIEAGLDPEIIWKQPQDWQGLERYVDPWIGQAAQELAKAALSVCSVIDFEAILLDGAFPESVRNELVERVRRYLVNQDKRGLIAPKIEPGMIGGNAREIGAASSPIFKQFFLNTNAGLSSA